MAVGDLLKLKMNVQSYVSIYDEENKILSIVVRTLKKRWSAIPAINKQASIIKNENPEKKEITKAIAMVAATSTNAKSIFPSHNLDACEPSPGFPNISANDILFQIVYYLIKNFKFSKNFFNSLTV